jgi:DNA-binding Xre family transcriptional regulator
MTPEQLALEIKKILLERGKSETQVYKEIGFNQQNLNKKLNSGTIRYSEVEAILDNLGYDIHWIKREK